MHHVTVNNISDLKFNLNEYYKNNDIKLIDKKLFLSKRLCEIILGETMISRINRYDNMVMDFNTDKCIYRTFWCNIQLPYYGKHHLDVYIEEVGTTTLNGWYLVSASTKNFTYVYSMSDRVIIKFIKTIVNYYTTTKYGRLAKIEKLLHNG